MKEKNKEIEKERKNVFVLRVTIQRDMEVVSMKKCVCMCVGVCVGACVWVRVCGCVCVGACVWVRVCVREREKGVNYVAYCFKSDRLTHMTPRHSLHRHFAKWQLPYETLLTRMPYCIVCQACFINTKLRGSFCLEYKF